MTVRRDLRWLCVLGFIGLLGGCGGSPPSPPPPPARPAPGTPAPTAAAKAPEPPPLPPKPYEARGQRDPFRPLNITEKSKGLGVASLKLVGIIHGRQGPLALMETPDGLGYILRAGDVVGDGRVLEIGTESVTFGVIRQAGEPPTRVVIRLKRD